MRQAITALFVSLACGAGAFACATGVASDDSSGDAQSDSSVAPDVRNDSGSSGCPTGYTGAGCTSCAGGFHMCGTSCEQDHANVPDAGCTLGCNNLACSPPPNATAKCTSDGKCDFACGTSFNKADGGCACPTGQRTCNGSCQECCTDNDCVGHQTCTKAGVCSGCEPGWGDCDNNRNNGCETHLNSTSNCGACGHSCCGAFCGCGFLGLGGESCNASGNSFACGC